MSDDGWDGYDSDFEDAIWDAEAGPDLAEDLASGAVHDPVFFDEPGYELVHYHSDWSAYSDDYYDDDPSILKDNPVDGNPVRARNPRSQGQKRGKKRKLVEVQDTPEIDLGERKMLPDCMRGTVWAKPVPERNNVFIPGEEDKIALLRDWKEKFGTTSVQDKSNSARPRLTKDESWANDMSLADMGLSNARGSMAEEGADGIAQVDEDEDEDRMELNEETAAALLQQMEGMDEEEAAALYQKLKEQLSLRNTPAAENTAARRQHPLAEVGGSSPLADDTTELMPVLKKQRLQHTESLPSPPQSNQSPILDNSDTTAPAPVDAEGESSARIVKQGRVRPRKFSTIEQNLAATAPGQGGTKKRKASESPSPERSKGVARSTASSRAKRVASHIDGVGSETEKEHGRSHAPTRSTRTRKKV